MTRLIWTAGLLAIIFACWMMCQPTEVKHVEHATGDYAIVKTDAGGGWVEITYYSADGKLLSKRERVGALDETQIVFGEEK
jgi:hypothetical protein